MAANEYDIDDAKTHWPEILEHVEAKGEEVVITRSGKPIARIVPERPRELGFARDEVKLMPGWEDPLTLEDFLGG